MEIIGSLQLIAGNLCHQCAVSTDTQCLVHQRGADIAAYAGLILAVLSGKQVSCEGNSSSLAIGTGDGIERRCCQMIGQLHFTLHMDFLTVSSLNKRYPARHCRRSDDSRHTFQLLLSLGA